VNIDSTNILDLAIGTDRRTIEPGDMQVTLPPILYPTVPVVKTHLVAPSATNAKLQSSGLFTISQTRTNQVALSTGIVLLGQGLWDISIALATQFNYLGAVGTFNGVHVELVLLTIATIPLLERFASITVNNDIITHRLLLNHKDSDLARIQITTDVTGVGQTADAKVTLNCVRLL
jgi:hypothetical protein